ncbi:MAG: glycosyltransferase family 39 protein [Deltaproteobacteria bacterium]|nr:glycosyltransferase family 39 protein [Deltaproteobacteria bacterium]
MPYSDIKKILIPASIFAAITIAVYFPIAANPQGFVNGSLDDAYAILWHLWWFKYSLLDLYASPSFSAFVESPFGVGVSHITIVNHLIALPFTWLWGPVASYNVMILLSFFLSALGMYLLAHEVTVCKTASFLSAVAYAFSPYHTTFSATGGMDAAQIQYLPFTLFFLLRYARTKDVKDIMLFFLFLVFSILSFGYHGPLIVLSVALFLIYKWVAPPALKFSNLEVSPLKFSGAVFAAYLLFVLADNTLEGVLPSIKTAVFFLAPVALFISAKNTDAIQGAYQKVIDEIKGVSPRRRFAFFAGALISVIAVFVFLYPIFGAASRSISSSYFAPVYSFFIPSPDHALIGSFVPEVLIPSPDPLVGKFVRVGFVLTLLTLFALRKNEDGRIKNKGFFISLLLIGVALSLPPAIKINDFTLYGPMHYFHALVPPFVDVRRVSLLILISACVLAGVGYYNINSRIKSYPAKVFLYLPLLFILGIEFYPGLSIKEMGRVPQAYKWLALQQGNFTVIEYPLTSIYDLKRYEPFYGQSIHKKNIVNPFGAVGHDPSPANEALKPFIRRGGPANEIFANSLNAVSTLASLNVDYVIIRKDKIPNPIIAGESGLKPIAVFNDSAVYEITARPAEAYISFADFYKNGYFLNYSEKKNGGFVIENPFIQPPHTIENKKIWMWMGKRAGLTITAINGDGDYELHFNARALTENAVLRIKGEGFEQVLNVNRQEKEFIIKGIHVNRSKGATLELEVPDDSSLVFSEGYLDQANESGKGALLGVGINGAVLKKVERFEKKNFRDFDGLYIGEI